MRRCVWGCWVWLVLGCASQADSGEVVAAFEAGPRAVTKAAATCDAGWRVSEIEVADTGFRGPRVGAVTATPDGGLVVAGSVYADPGFSAFWTARLNAAGEVQWHSITQTPDFDVLGVVSVESDGDVLALGRTGYNAWLNDAYAVRLSPEGEVRWEATYGGSRDETWSGRARLEGGDWLLAGAVADHHPLRRDAWLVRLDPRSGAPVWERTVKRGDAAVAYGAAARGNGAVLTGAAGTSAWVFAVDSEGELRWEAKHPGDGDSSWARIEPLGDDAFVVVGNDSHAQWATPRLARITGDGVTEWEVGSDLQTRLGWTPQVIVADDAIFVSYQRAPVEEDESEGTIWEAVLERRSGAGSLEWRRTIRGERLSALTAAPTGGFWAFRSRDPRMQPVAIGLDGVVTTGPWTPEVEYAAARALGFTERGEALATVEMEDTIWLARQGCVAP